MTRLFTLLLVFSLFAACGGPEGTEVDSTAALEETTTTEMVKATQFVVDPATSVVNWEGSKKIGGGHTGTIPVTQGQLMVAEGRLVGGKFSLDIRELKNTDLDEDSGRDKLVGHLKSGDFFDVEKFPMAEFVITNVQPQTDGTDGVTHNITGNLTLKGQSRSVTLPATVSMDGNQFKASTPKFTIDRKEWGMDYGSGSLAGIAQDNIINDEVGLELMIVANK